MLVRIPAPAVTFRFATVFALTGSLTLIPDAIESTYCLVAAPSADVGGLFNRTSPFPSGIILIFPSVLVLDIVFPSTCMLSTFS